MIRRRPPLAVLLLLFLLLAAAGCVAEGQIERRRVIHVALFPCFLYISDLEAEGSTAPAEEESEDPEEAGW